jgi:hypothetical protein
VPTSSTFKRRAHRFFAAPVVAALVAIGVPEAAHAQSILVVDQDGSGTANDCGAGIPAFSTGIQAAIDAASPGDVIFVCPGTYDEQLVVRTGNLTIRGAGAGSTVLRPAVVVRNAVRPGTTLPVAPIVLIDEVSGVTVTNLTVDGSAADSGMAIVPSCGGAPVYAGLYYKNASGTVDTVRVTDIMSAAACPFAVLALTDQSGAGRAANVVVKNSLVHHFGIAGILCAGQNTACTVTDSVVRGEGPVSDLVQLGVVIRAEARGSISRNVITDHFFLGAGASAVGIFMSSAHPSTNAQLLRSNVFADNQVNVTRFGAAMAFD